MLPFALPISVANGHAPLVAHQTQTPQLNCFFWAKYTHLWQKICLNSLYSLILRMSLYYRCRIDIKLLNPSSSLCGLFSFWHQIQFHPYLLYCYKLFPAIQVTDRFELLPTAWHTASEVPCMFCHNVQCAFQFISIQCVGIWQKYLGNM